MNDKKMDNSIFNIGEACCAADLGGERRADDLLIARALMMSQRGGETL